MTQTDNILRLNPSQFDVSTLPERKKYMKHTGIKRSQLSNEIMQQRKIQRIIASLPDRMKANGKGSMKFSLATSSSSTSSPGANLHDYMMSVLSAKGLDIKVQSHDSLNDFFYDPTPEEIESYKHDVLTAVREKDLKTLRSFYEQGRKLKCSNKFGESLLHLACRKGLVDVTDFLVNEAEVPLRVRDDYGRSPLHDACWTVSPNFDLVDLIVRNCPDLLFITDRRGHTPLFYVRKEHWGIWKIYLSRKADFLVPKDIGYAKM